jgi:hypothetical protein
MLCTESIAFIHVQKTGGMSVTRFLVNAIDDPVTVFVPEQALDHARRMAETPAAAAKLTCQIGTRHEDPEQAATLIERHALEKPRLAFSVIRSPVELMLSYYKHMRKPRVWRRRGMSEKSLTGAPKLAMEYDFDTFCRKVLFYNKTDAQLLRYFQPRGFEKLDVVPLSRLNEYLQLRFGHHANFDADKLEHRNKSQDTRQAEDVRPETISHIETTYPKVLHAYKTALEHPFD